MAEITRIDQIDNATDAEIEVAPLTEIELLGNLGVAQSPTQKTARKFSWPRMLKLLRRAGLWIPEKVFTNADFILTEADSGRLIEMTGATPKTITLSNLPAGFRAFVFVSGSGVVTFAGAATLFGLTTLAQNQSAWLEHIGNNVWRLEGINSSSEFLAAVNRVSAVESRASALEQWKRDITNSRYILNFNGNKHATLNTVIVTANQNLTVEIDASFVTTGTTQYLTDGDTTATRFLISTTTSDRIVLPSGATGTIDGATITSGTTIFPADGKIHKLIITHATSTHRLAHLGRAQAQATTGRWAGFITRLKVTVGATVTTFKMDAQITTTENSVENNNILTYTGVVANDWIERQITPGGSIVAPSVTVTATQIKAAYTTYVSASQIYVYQQLSSGKWLRFDIRRETDIAGKKVDVWRVWHVQHGTMTGATPLENPALTGVIDLSLAQSQWEYATRLQGTAANGFIGGTHGYETVSNVVVSQDGKPLALPTLATGYDRFEISQEVEWWHPLTPTTKVANAFVRHVWDKNGLSVQLEVEWLVSDTVILAYGGMLPARNLAANNVSTKARYVGRATIYNTTQGVADFDAPVARALGAEVYNDTNSIAMKVEVQPEWFANWANGAAYLIKHVNGSYDKLYAIRVAQPNTEAVTAATRWLMRSQYTFQEK